jgi:signal transduction histidine kinase
MDLLTRLAEHRSLASAPAAEHAWLATHGALTTYAPGDVVTAKGTQAQNLLVVFSGHLVIRVDRGAGAHKLFEWRGGDLGGVMPYSRGASPPNDVVAEEPTEVLAVRKEQFPDMLHACPVITATLVHAMVDRARQFTSSDLRDEKLISLGKLASGLAHELNNPASAVVRSAKLLANGLSASDDAARQLGAAQLSAEQLQTIDEVRKLCASAASTELLTAMARADREDSIAEWLDAHDADAAWANPLADTAVTLAVLDTLAGTISGPALDATLRWLASGCLVHELANEIETAATRIYDLVAAVKGFSFMDRAPSPEPVDIRRGIADTLTMLGGKLRAKAIDVTVTLADDLPRAHAIGAELNQVWMNLIDNAIDAVPVRGHIVVSASAELHRVSVRIIDDGAGIPTAIQGRIFDPFFTTKGVGSGTGLGLDIVRRLLQRHEGDISVDSVPGRTEFQVMLPATE